MQNDKRFIFMVATHAQRIANHLHSYQNGANESCSEAEQMIS
jgi:antirestriction protein ArdC